MTCCMLATLWWHSVWCQCCMTCSMLIYGLWWMLPPMFWLYKMLVEWSMVAFILVTRIFLLHFVHELIQIFWAHFFAFWIDSHFCNSVVWLVIYALLLHYSTNFWTCLFLQDGVCPFFGILHWWRWSHHCFDSNGIQIADIFFCISNFELARATNVLII